MDLLEFKKQINAYCDEIGLQENGNIASHRLKGSLVISNADPTSDKDYELVDIDIVRLMGCGCWAGIILEIKEVESN